MINKDIIIKIITQLWILQFVFFIIDIYSKFNIEAFFPFISYIILVNLLMLFSMLFYKLTYIKRIGFLVFALLFLFFKILGFLINDILFINSIWLINSGFILFFIVFNKYRKSIIALVDSNAKDSILIFISLLFLLQFIFLNLAYSIIVSIIFLLVIWYLYSNKFLSFFEKEKTKSIGNKIIEKKVNKPLKNKNKKNSFEYKKYIIKFLFPFVWFLKIESKIKVNIFLIFLIISGFFFNLYIFSVIFVLFIINLYIYFSKGSINLNKAKKIVNERI